MEEAKKNKVKALGFIKLTRKQFVVFETLLLTFFLSIAVFLFVVDALIETNDPIVSFHLKYTKFISLICVFLVIIEAQFFMSRFVKLHIKEINGQRREIIKQKNEVVRQNDKISQQNLQITDSITYASQIQKAVMPPKSLLNSLLSDYFILYKPKHIVSGDFYWITERKNKIILAVADCTGHGVPGAFMSMLGVSSLNEIVNYCEENKLHKANVILNKLRTRIITALRQKGKENETRDGIDIALSIIDFENLTLQFSGAHNSLYHIRENENEAGKFELTQVKADRMPIGYGYKTDVSFSNHEVKLKLNDTIYMFSDGYVDQFGEDNKRKYMSRRFKELLVNIQNKSMSEQKEILKDTHYKWRGNTGQIDDILVMGVRINSQPQSINNDH